MRKRTASLTVCFEKLKKRSIRLYRDATKAIYGEGPYVLSPAYAHLKFTYEDFRDMSKVEKDNVLKRFYSYVLNNTVLINNGYILDESTENLKELSAQKNVNVQTNTLIHLEREQPQRNVEQEQQLPNMERHPKLPFKPADFKLTKEFNFPKEVAENIFSKAIKLIEEEGAITKAASSDLRMRTVKSTYGRQPQIIAPTARNPDYLTSKCRTFIMFDLCHHTLAVSVDLNIVLNFMNEVIKKLKQKVKQKRPMCNLTAAIESSLNVTQKGKRKNEITRKKKTMTKQSITTTTVAGIYPAAPVLTSTTTQLIPSSHSNSSTIQLFSSETSDEPTQPRQNTWNSIQIGARPFEIPPSYAYIDTGTQPQPCRPDFNLISTSNSALTSCSQPAITCRDLNLPAQWQPSVDWNTASSPYYYEIVLLPCNVTKCYGCCKEFASKYRVPPHNVVVRHKDKRIIGRNEVGGVKYGSEFQNTYYHLNLEHIKMKNYLFDSNVFINLEVGKTLTPAHFDIIMVSGLTINKI